MIVQTNRDGSCTVFLVKSGRTVPRLGPRCPAIRLFHARAMGPQLELAAPVLQSTSALVIMFSQFAGIFGVTELLFHDRTTQPRCT